jgi:hypothetical protein
MTSMHRTHRRFAFPSIVAIAILASIMVGMLPTAASADGTWLDESPPANWNTPGMSVPQAPPSPGPIDPRVLARNRWAESQEDVMLAQAGWHLFTQYQSGWGVKIVPGASAFDGMGRPNGYQNFVFVDGVFAGTLAPDVMDARTDGAASTVFLTGADSLNAEFLRYASTDPLCCPSGTSFVTYQINRTDAGPVVVAVSTTTQKNPTAQSETTQ